MYTAAMGSNPKLVKEEGPWKAYVKPVERLTPARKADTSIPCQRTISAYQRLKKHT